MAPGAPSFQTFRAGMRCPLLNLASAKPDGFFIVSGDRDDEQSNYRFRVSQFTTRAIAMGANWPKANANSGRRPPVCFRASHATMRTLTSGGWIGS